MTTISKIANEEKGLSVLGKWNATIDKANSNENRVENLEDNQTTGVKVYSTFEDEGGGLSFLPVNGVSLVSYKVTNDPDKKKNGYYHWETTAYVKDSDLVDSDLDPDNESDAVSGAGIERFTSKNKTPYNSRFDENSNLGASNVGGWSVEIGSVTISQEEEGVRFDTLNTDTFRLANNTFISEIPLGGDVYVKFKIKRLNVSGSMYFDVTTSTSGHLLSSSEGWQTVFLKLPKTSEYADRVSFIIVTSSELQSFIIKDMIISDSEIAKKSEFEGLKLSVVGDSIGTANDNNAVELKVIASDIGNSIEAYVTKQDFDAGLTIGGYTVIQSDIGLLKTFSPVSGDEGKVVGLAANYNPFGQANLWWYIMAENLGMSVLQNNSWSGSSMSSHEGNLEQYETSYAWHPATINKCSKRDLRGDADTPDMIIISRGTNDFSHLPYSKLTSYGADATEIPVDDTVNVSEFGFKEAIAITVEKYREAYPFAEIVLCTMNIFKRGIYDHFPVRTSAGTLPQYNNAIREVADMMGCRVIEFDKSGITFENIYPTYASDSPTMPTHPNTTGHKKLAEKAIVDMKS